jgi:cellulose synthase/poly-beta-1,6-N-acetylglucosamine synthase-like glycosyltransferase
MEPFLVVLTVSGHVCVVLYLLRGLSEVKIKNQKPEYYADISVIIPFRNEAQHLHTLLSSIAKTDYPTAHCEFILVDDHSEDIGQGSLMEISERLGITNLRIIALQGEEIGKKAAIQKGMENATFGIIAQTDADVELPAQWLQEINNVFADPNIQLAFGPVNSQNTPPLFDAKTLSRTEYAMTHALSVAQLGNGSPISCSGANMAYRKKTRLDLESVMEGKEYASGDDFFVLKTFANKLGYKSIGYIPSAVRSKMPDTLEGIILQRKRWASKLVKGAFSKSGLGLGLIFYLHTFLIYTLALRPLSGLLAALVMALGEYILLKQFSKISGGWGMSFVRFYFLRIIYAVWFIALIPSTMLKTSEWKGRKI